MYCRCCSATAPLLVPGPRQDRPETGQQHTVGRRHHPPVSRPQVVPACALPGEVFGHLVVVNGLAAENHVLPFQDDESLPFKEGPG